jgi:hypothetical protein
VRRTLSLAVLVTLISLLPASSANAGGNWLAFREDPRADTSRRDPAGADRNLGTWAVLHVGQHVVAATGVYAPEPRQRRLEREAPFYAWLVPEGSFGGGTRVPETAIRLAPFELRWISKRSAAVRARFTVAAVPSGKYEVIVCNEPCTYSGFGEYVEGWFTVMQTPDEARLLPVARARNGRARELSRKVKNHQVEVVAHDAELERSRARSRRSRRIEHLRPKVGRWSPAGLSLSLPCRSLQPRSSRDVAARVCSWCRTPFPTTSSKANASASSCSLRRRARDLRPGRGVDPRT